jgi:murein DD-endopeptidase MepM/ murein hydrolase activator NlpD
VFQAGTIQAKSIETTRLELLLRKRFYIMFVARDPEGELRKIPIPLHYAYVFLAGALIGMLSITGMAGSYTRMLMKVTRFNQIRAEREQLKDRYSRLEKAAQERDLQVASLGSLASEITTIYGLKPDPVTDQPATKFTAEQVAHSLTQLSALRISAMAGVATINVAMGSRRRLTMADWVRMAEAPTLWPVEGRITGAFGERLDPFNGEGAFHRGLDISAPYGQPVVAPADGVISYADLYSGYGRLVEVEHPNGVTTRFGHLSAFAVSAGQTIHRGDVLGYVGMSGRTTGPHLHYEVWVQSAPVNPYKYLRTTLFRASSMASGS